MVTRVLQALLAAQAAIATTPPIRTLFSLPDNASWLENLAYRRSTDTILATRLDVAQLWSISATTGAGTILADVSDITALVGITQTHTSPDEFYVAGLNFTTAGVQPNSSALWKLAFPVDNDDNGFTFEPAFGVPGMTLINGLNTWNETTILATDSRQGNIWAIDLITHSAAPALQDPSMAPTSSNGVNGVKVLRAPKDTAYVYYTSTDQALLARLPVDPVTIRTQGPAHIIARDLGAVDDFELSGADGSAVVATGGGNAIVRARLDGRVETVVESAVSQGVANATACRFGKGGGVLYVTTGGSAAAGRVVAVDSGDMWQDA